SQQALRAVQISKEEVEQPGSLDQTYFQDSPLRRGDQEGDGVELPGSVHPPGIAVDVVRDPVLANEVLRFLPTASDLVAAQYLERIDERQPVLPHAVIRSQQFVVSSPQSSVSIPERRPGWRLG